MNKADQSITIVLDVLAHAKWHIEKQSLGPEGYPSQHFRQQLLDNVEKAVESVRHGIGTAGPVALSTVMEHSSMQGSI